MNTTDPVHVIAHHINTIGHVKAFVQPNGRLRIAARSCAAADVAIDRAANATRIDACQVIDRFEVRFTGRDNKGKILTYPYKLDPDWQLDSRLDKRTGAFLPEHA